ncbi:MAG: hypothetical protein WC967_15370 [Balneolaceae bacterium]
MRIKFILIIATSIIFLASVQLFAQEKAELIEQVKDTFAELSEPTLYIDKCDLVYENPEKFYTLSVEIPIFYRSLWRDFNADGTKELLMTGKYKVKEGGDFKKKSFLSMLSVVNGRVIQKGFIESNSDELVIRYFPDAKRPVFAIYFGEDDLWWVTWNDEDFQPLGDKEY